MKDDGPKEDPITLGQVIGAASWACCAFALSGSARYAAGIAGARLTIAFVANFWRGMERYRKGIR